MSASGYASPGLRVGNMLELRLGLRFRLAALRRMVHRV